MPKTKLPDNIDQLVENRLSKMLKESPPELLTAFVIVMGKAAVEANAGAFTVSAEADIKGIRYKITTVTKFKNVLTDAK